MAIWLPGSGRASALRGRGRHFWLSLFALITATAVLSGCGKGGVPTVSSVSITPSSASVGPGAQTDFTATVNLANTTTTSTTSTSVTWEVNGVAGGNSTIGTIVSSSTDNQLGIYTAPTTVPSTNNGEVNITAVAQQTNTTASNATTVTSNTAVVTIAVTQGFSMSPTVSTVPAGGTIQFSAILNGVTDTSATWTVSSSSGGNPGTINPSTGLYTAPLLPPPGNSIKVTSQDGSDSASETLTVTYSDHSLTGPYSFSYTGDNQLGFYAVVGSFVSDGNGNIESGVEDVDGFLSGVTPATSFTGNYVVGPDGRGSVTLSNGNNWRFALGTNQHAAIIRFDAGDTGSGTIDQQNLNALSNSATVLSGPYVFAGLGADKTFNALAMAGRFSADGAGNIPSSGTVLDVNDGGSVTKSDTSLNGSYSFDANLPGTGRGTLTLTSSSTGQRQYTFYVVDGTHLRFVETDQNAYFAGDAFTGMTGSSFSAANLASGAYVFEAGGNSSAGAYSAAGAFTSDGAGNLTGGVIDANNGGTVQSDASLTSCPLSVDGTTGRIDLKLCGAGTSEFAVYQTAQSFSLFVELDATAVSAGKAYQQSVSSTTPAGNFVFNLAAQGIFHNSPSSYQQDLEGQIILNGSAVTGGTLDVNNFSEVFANNPINISTITTTSGGTTTTTTASTISAPGSDGRGTAVITGTNPSVTYKLVYYLIDADTALLFDQDSAFILNGILLIQH